MERGYRCDKGSRLFWSGLLVLWVVAMVGACEPPEEEGASACGEFGTRDTQLCVCGVELVRLCGGDGSWGEWSGTCEAACEDATDEPEPTLCEPGVTDERACGECGRQARYCLSGQWSQWSECEEAPSCAAQCGDREVEQEDCGVCGTRTRACQGGSWGAWGACLEAPGCAVDECEPRDSQEQLCSDGCSTSVRVCGPDGRWSDWGQCQPGDSCIEPVCQSGAMESRPCGNCGTQYRGCQGGQWMSWGTCDESQCQGCSEGEVRTRACGGCGVEVATCLAGRWSDFGACDEPVECPGTCDTLRTVFTSPSEEIFIGIAGLAGGKVAVTGKDSWDSLGSLRVVDPADGSVTYEETYGSWWDPVTVTEISAPVYDASTDELMLTYATWQAQFGDDGPEMYLKVMSSLGEQRWSTHVWSYDEYTAYEVDTSTPVLAGDLVLVNTASMGGGMGMQIEQLIGYSRAGGEMAFSVDNPLATGVISSADGSSAYSHGSGLVFHFGTDSAAETHLLHYWQPDTNSSVRKSYQPALSRDEQVLYVATSVYSYDVAPARDAVVAVRTALPELPEDPEVPDFDNDLWTRYLDTDQRISDAPVLTPSLVVVPLADGVLALDRADGSVARRFHTGGRVTNPVAGDAGVIYFLEWGEDDVTLGSVGVDGRPVESCVVSSDARLVDEAGQMGLYGAGRVSPVLRGGVLTFPVAGKVYSLDVASAELADTGWPRRHGDNHNSGRPAQ